MQINFSSQWINQFSILWFTFQGSPPEKFLPVLAFASSLVLYWKRSKLSQVEQPNKKKI